MSQPFIAILDVGKTNKKLLLFDDQYRMVWEKTNQLPQAKDEDGDPCEDLDLLEEWVAGSFYELFREAGHGIRAVNCSAYGASFVHIGANGKPITPLYNYLKAYPPALQDKFYQEHGGAVTFSMLAASPVLGNLNSGMQLYRLKMQQPKIFERIRYSLHLPQYISYLLTRRPCSDITSIGCHTNLWNFSQNNYHEWVYREGIIGKLAPIVSPTVGIPAQTPWDNIVAGTGLHDSSAAMIPYLESFREPFILLSTGTWCISMNPFNESPLTIAELQKDCLCYMTYQGRPVKASRLFAGYDHEEQVKRLAAHFHTVTDHYHSVSYDSNIIAELQERRQPGRYAGGDTMMGASVFGKRDLSEYTSYEEAYHQLIMDIMSQQIESTTLVLTGTPVKRIFVDGGFGRNPIYMQLLAEAFPQVEVFAASVPQATALGAALTLHPHWNARPLPGDLIELKYYNHHQ